MDVDIQTEDRIELDLEGLERVVVRIVAGEVTVTAGEQPRCEVRRESGAPVDVQMHAGVLYITHPEPELAPLERFIKWLTEGRRHRCTVAVTAPPSATVEVTTVSAPAVISGFDGRTTVKTVSGDVTLSRLATSVDVKTVSGDVDAKAINAELKLKSVSGDMSVVDGSCRRIDAKSVSGEVLLDLDLDPSGTYDVTTVSGDVAVRTISEPNFSIDVNTVSGDLISDFGLGFEARSGRRRLYETVGSGGARLRVKTVSGDLRVVRGRAAA